MAMKRYLHVRGKQGVLVTNPHTPDDPLRFVGQKRKDMPPSDALGMADLFEPIVEVVEDHVDLMKPIRRGEIDLLDKIGARSLEHALRHFEKSAKPVEKQSKKEVTHG